MGNDFAAMYPGAWAYVNHVIGGPNGIFIVFNYDNGVAQVAKMGKGAQQAIVISLMKPYRGFVQDVHNANKACANLAGESYALRFTSRQGVSTAFER